MGEGGRQRKNDLGSDNDLDMKTFMESIASLYSKCVPHCDCQVIDTHKLITVVVHVFFLVKFWIRHPFPKIIIVCVAVY